MFSKRRAPVPKPAARKAAPRKTAVKRATPKAAPAIKPIAPAAHLGFYELIAAALEHLADLPQHRNLGALVDQMHAHLADMRGTDGPNQKGPADATRAVARPFHRT